MRYVHPDLELRIRDRLARLVELVEQAQGDEPDDADTPQFDANALGVALGKQLNLHPARQLGDGPVDCATCTTVADYAVPWPCEYVDVIAEAVGVGTGAKRRR